MSFYGVMTEYLLSLLEKHLFQPISIVFSMIGQERSDEESRAARVLYSPLLETEHTFVKVNLELFIICTLMISKVIHVC